MSKFQSIVASIATKVEKATKKYVFEPNTPNTRKRMYQTCKDALEQWVKEINAKPIEEPLTTDTLDKISYEKARKKDRSKRKK